MADSPIREIHGVANGRRRSVGDADHAVTVRDGDNGEVILETASSTYGTALTPEQARMIARQLRAAADRVEALG